ncbi:hypothetical protein [Halopiger goleimassiliensis]|uniref:hypothetical protein n=1 Tax=Halopiger goleimassiliensis TaxID=1293048 RepID=UPI000678026B|nr:hypothetical protein [Halopiger goleimassiliensis]
MTDDSDAPARNDDPIDDREDGSSDEVEIEITRGVAPDRDTDREGSRDSGGSVDDDVSPRRPRYPPETDLADELGRIDVMTTPEGYVEGRITDLTTVDETTVRLTASLPHGETVSFTLEKPIPWSREFLLARIVEDAGYDAASIDHAVGEPVYLQRTDLEEDDADDWWSPSLQAAGDALLSSLSGGRYRLERETGPEWRLVDPLERPHRTDGDAAATPREALLGAGIVVFGVVIAAVGAVIGATGGLVLSSGVVGAVLLGLLIVTLGLGVVFRSRREH